MSTDRWGVQQDYLDADDRPARSSDASVARIRAVLGEPPADLEDRAPVVTRRGRPWPHGPAQVRCEDGSTARIDDVVPDDLPLGYHRWRPVADDGAAVERLLAVSPGRCWVPPERRWGWAVQLYAARSRRSWGIGDLADLRSLREWTEEHGGGFLLVNPLHAVAPVLPMEPSPYLPATRRFRNPVYLAVPEVPGVEEEDLAAVADEVAALRAGPAVDRDGAWRLKEQVLSAVWPRVRDDADLAAWRAEAGEELETFARWCVLTELHGPDWRAWPADLHDPAGAAVRAVARQHADRVGFHAWLQWLLARQLRDATGGTTVVQDLPIGVSGAGADAWAWQEVVASGATVGAPPDALNALGQDWGSPPFVPWRLRLADHGPFVASVRDTIAGAGGLRIDHVMGLFRLWFVPEGAGPADGVYVRFPSEDLLDLVALESHRARAVVVGEDLGTVEPGVREALAERGILSYRVLWFEDDEPSAWPEDALAAVTTHDLPTVAGLWAGSDAHDQQASTGMRAEDVQAGRQELLARLTRTGLEAGASVEDAVAAAYTQLAAAPCRMLALSLEDALAEERRPNVPGTTDRDNWRIPLPVPLEDALADPRLVELVGRFADAGASA